MIEDDFLATRRILVIDDNRAIHDDFTKILCPKDSTLMAVDAVANDLFGDDSSDIDVPKFEIDSAYQGQDGLELVKKALQENRPYPVAFVDVRMPPGWDGIETTKHIWEVDPTMQIVICTAYSDYSTADVVSQLGMTDRLLILKKPFDIAEVTLLAIALSEKWQLTRKVAEANHDLQKHARRLTEWLDQRTVELAGTRGVAVFALAKLAESRDPETGEHLERMRAFAQVLGKQLASEGAYASQIDAEFLDNFYLSTPLHDIGKVGTPDKILLKPGRLTPDEFEIMKRHTLIGATALESAAHHSSFGSFLAMAAEVARFHHERYDGTGYPDGLSGHEIPLSARITAVADVFDALTSRRVYKDAMDPEEAKKIIIEERGKHFDPVVVDAFLECYEEFLQVKAAIEQVASERSELAPLDDARC